MKTLTALLMTIASVSHAQIAVLMPKPVNVAPGEAEAVQVICAQAYRTASRQSALTVTDVEAARGAGATEVLELTLIGLDGRKGKKIIVSGARKTIDGANLYEQSFEALTMEDMPTVCSRLATSLFNKESAEVAQSHTNLTAAEASKQSRRLRSNVSFGVKTGITAAVSGAGILSPMGGLAFDVRLDNEQWFAEAGVGFLIPAPVSASGGYGGISADLGANYYLAQTDIAPYIGGGIQPRLVFSGSFFNLVPYAQVGVVFGRKSRVHFFTDLRVGQNVLPAMTSGFGGAGSYPTEFNLNAGLGF